MNYYTKENICTTCITDDGSHCLSVCADGVVELYNLHKKSSQLVRVGHDICSKWPPLLTSDKSLLVVPGATEQSLQIIDPREQQVRHSFTCDGSIINAVEDKANKRLFIAYGINKDFSTEDFCLSIIDLTTPNTKQDIKNIKLLVNKHSKRTKITIDKQGEKIAFGDMYSVRLYDVKSGSTVDLCAPSQGRAGTDCVTNALEVDFHPHGNYISFCNSDGQVFEYDLRNNSYSWRNYYLSKGYSIAYDKTGDGLICGANTLALLNKEGKLDYTIESSKLGKIQSVYLNTDNDTWLASTAHNSLIAGTLSALKQKKEREKQESDRRADYDALMESFRVAYCEKMLHAQYGTWTADYENELQEIEKRLRLMGQELGINDFDQE